MALQTKRRFPGLVLVSVAEGIVCPHNPCGCAPWSALPSLLNRQLTRTYDTKNRPSEQQNPGLVQQRKMLQLRHEDIEYQTIYHLAFSQNERRDMARDPPPEVIASWPPPNISSPHSKGPTLLIVELLLITIVCVVVLLRIYSRVYLRKTFGLDDWFILPATVGKFNLRTPQHSNY